MQVISLPLTPLKLPPTPNELKHITEIDIMVLDNAGRTADIVTALNEGYATIADLDFYGIEYYTKSKQ